MHLTLMDAQARDDKQVGSDSLSRRGFVSGLGSILAGFALPSRGDVAPGLQIRNGVDVHHHLAPPTMIAKARESGILPAILGQVTAESSLGDLDRAGIRTAVTSISWPGIHFTDADTTVRLARECNEYAATLNVRFPGRFGMFATLPMPLVEQSLTEIAYGLDTLDADGVHLWTSYGDKWLGHPDFQPILAELHRRRAVVFVHPSTAACCGNLVLDVPVGVVEYGTDTSRAIASLLFSGSASKYSDIKFIFAHAGGTAPYLIERMLFNARKPEVAARLPHGVLFELRRFYYETAQATNRGTLISLKDLVPTSQILCGSDYPYRTAQENVSGLQDSRLFNHKELDAICSRNSHALLPHLGTAQSGRS
jgi:predicted TIM-barrel fold metal-dependent hydrolase